MADTQSYTLLVPITRTLQPVGGEPRTEEVTQLTLRKLKGKDLRGAPSNQADMMLHMLRRSSGLTDRDIDEMDLADVAGASEILEGFLPDGLKTGATSSGT